MLICGVANRCYPIFYLHRKSLAMFIDNKYTKWYNNIISKYTEYPPTGYTETHHILPRSMGGSDNSPNLVKLTAKAHFICHVLLIKMTSGRNLIKMKYALTLMIGKNHLKRTSRFYSDARLGWTQSEDHVNKRVASKKGYKHNAETIKKLCLAANNREVVYKTCICGVTIDSGNYAKYHGDNCGKTGLCPITDEQKIKISLANKNRVLPKHECPHCKILVDMGNYNRWHGDKCKQKEINDHCKNNIKK